jgi:hypothetical protein
MQQSKKEVVNAKHRCGVEICYKLSGKGGIIPALCRGYGFTQKEWSVLQTRSHFNDLKLV